jgi:hypothetical protein
MTYVIPCHPAEGVTPECGFPRRSLFGRSAPYGVTSIVLFANSFVVGCYFDATFLYNIAVTAPTYIVQNLTEYFSGVMCLVLTFHCWHLDWRGGANATTKASYVALVCLLLLIMALPAMGL